MLIQWGSIIVGAPAPSIIPDCDYNFLFLPLPSSLWTLFAQHLLLLFFRGCFMCRDYWCASQLFTYEAWICGPRPSSETEAPTDTLWSHSLPDWGCSWRTGLVTKWMTTVYVKKPHFVLVHLPHAAGLAAEADTKEDCCLVTVTMDATLSGSGVKWV